MATCDRPRFDENGLLTSLDIGGGRRIDGDLFVDATGFQGRLIEGELGDPWIDWSQHLLCDAAVAMPLPRDAAYPPYTLSSAARAGWIWRIPLQSRVGAGYVYSRAHLSEDEAMATLVTRSGLADKRAADPRSLKMRVGRRTRFWLRNCVAIGLASGFVEPLESTGIHLIFQAVKLLVDYWPDARLRRRRGARTTTRWARSTTRCAISSNCITRSPRATSRSGATRLRRR